MPGVPELLVILAIVFLIFGAAKLPQLARSLGKAKTEFHEGMKEGGGTDSTAEAPAAQAQTTPQATPEDQKSTDGAQS
jgi:sec-independent protein translocase protein TatA